MTSQILLYAKFEVNDVFVIRNIIIRHHTIKSVNVNTMTHMLWKDPIMN